jgi:hypothetical protein
VLANEINQIGLEQAHNNDLNNTGDQGIGTKEEVYGRYIKRIQKAPVGRRLTRVRERPPGFGKGKAVPLNQPQRQMMVGELVKRAGQNLHPIAKKEGRPQPG